LTWILAGRKLTDADVDTLVLHLLDGHGLAKQKPPLAVVSFTPSAIDSGAAEPVTLLAVRDLQNVNALVPNQRLEFSEHATAVFGANGAGKSGYARLLGHVGFTRGDREVLPDAESSEQPNAPRSATIDFTSGGACKTMQVQFDGQAPELPGVHVFDSTSVHVHLTGSNRLSFAPLGMDCLTKLARLTDEVRQRLDEAVQEIEAEKNAFPDLLEGNSEVRTLLLTLGEASDMQTIRKLAIFGPEEQRVLKDAELRLAKARATSAEEQQAALAKAADAVGSIACDLRQAAEALSQEAIGAATEAASNVAGAQAEVDAVTTDGFKVDGLSQIGTPTWRAFVAAAHELASAESGAAAEYPQLGSPCLLCHRPIDAEARDLLHKLSAYLRDESLAHLTAAKAALRSIELRLTALKPNVLSPTHVAHGILEQRAPAVLSDLLQLQATLTMTRESLLAGIRSLDMPAGMPAAPTTALDALDKAHADLLEEAEATKTNSGAGTPALEVAWRGLDHRRRLSGILPQVEQFVQDRAWAAAARKVGGNTAHITKQYNLLFSDLVTTQYVERFRGLLKDLGRPMTVDVVTSGKKGEVQKKIALTLEAGAGWAQTDKILSEGEKRAVALADFLAEVTTDPQSSAVVLDDPVTSLDLDWRAQIARVLARQATTLQVIVFTHDLPFLYYFTQSCIEEDVPLRAHWVKRGDIDGLPGYVHLDNCPSMEQKYKSPERAIALWEKARSAGPELQEQILRDGFGALRTTYEAFIVFDLLGGVVERFEERISFSRLKGLVWDKALLDSIVERYETLSRQIEGHLHSNGMAAPEPTPDDLKKEIDEFIKLKKRLHDMKKASKLES
jgi:ABC-type Mn2+/Zn2+ transport system ATPase subunit